MIKFLSLLYFFLLTTFLFAKANKPYIVMIANEEPFFEKQLQQGALAAAKELGIEFSFQTFPSENALQVEVLNNVIAEKPAAIALATQKTASFFSKVDLALVESIVVVSFDVNETEVPDAKISTHVTADHYAGGRLAAEKMFVKIEHRLRAVTEEKPATVVALSEDSLSPHVIERARGFVNRMVELISELENIARKDIDVLGHPAFIDDEAPKRGKKIFINNLVAFKATLPELKIDAQAILNEHKKNNVLGVFASSELAAVALLEVSDTGRKLPAYGLVVVGSGAGRVQKEAVRAGYFLGSIIQDSYTIGYQALYTTYKLSQGEAVNNVRITPYFYNSKNIDDAIIQLLLYDELY